MSAVQHAALDQRHQALEKANAVRLARLELKKRIRSLPAQDGRWLAADVLTSGPIDITADVRVSQLLLAIRKVGWARVNRWLLGADIYSDRRISKLSNRQRSLLAEQLRL